MTTRTISRLATIVCCLAAMKIAAAEREIPPAFGPHVNLSEKDFPNSETFHRTNRIVGTYFFYWYDIYSKAHIIDRGDDTDALTTHPPTLDDFSYKSTHWHKKQLADMEAAGIDMALMVFWGSPAEHEPNAHLHWSFAGLPPLIQAREELLKEGRHPPRIGLFYDTSTLENNHWHYHADLTTDFGRRFFYGTIRDFFSCIPPKHWAMMDGKPIVLMYSPSFAKKWDQSVIDFAKAEFPKEFAGRVPWIAPQDAWNLKGDSTCAWGGALAFRNPGIGEIGPGYDHSAVPGRKPLVQPRDGGKFYEENWLKFLRRPSNFVMIETWNEFHEGTDIAESKEYGRQYIELTRKYSDRFKSNWKPPPVAGKYSKSNVVQISLGEKNSEAGLRQIECEDGTTKAVTKADSPARSVKPFRNSPRFMYFAVDDSFKISDPMDARVEVEYFSSGGGRLRLEFDGSDTNAPFSGGYSASPDIVQVPAAKIWTNATFNLPGARFRNSQNGGADFRLIGEVPELIVRRVKVTKR